MRTHPGRRECISGQPDKGSGAEHGKVYRCAEEQRQGQSHAWDRMSVIA